MKIIKKIWTTIITFFDADELTTPQLSDTVDLESNGYDGVQINIVANFSACPNNLVFSLYGSLDGSNFDDTPFLEMTLYNPTSNPTKLTFIIKDLAQLRIKFSQSGTVAGFISVGAEYKAWKLSEIEG